MMTRGMPSERKTMVLPVETMAREFDGKLLLGLCARERGWEVLIGNQAALVDRVPWLPPSVYFAKSARSSNARRFNWLCALGHEIVVLDEEALVRQSDEIYLMKHERDALKYVDLLLAWGPSNAELWRNSGLLNGLDAEPVGNPRIDMLRPELRRYHEAEIASIHARFGDYVLFNSNFATVNNVLSGSNRLNLAMWVPEETAATKTEGLLSHKRALFDHFLKLIPKLAGAIAPRRLIIRPHPSERHGPWQEAAADLPNVTVNFEGSVVPWIAGAKALVHNGCTSAVEAAVQGTTVLSYRPITSEAYDNPLPNSLGIECFSDEELLAALRQVLEDPRPLSNAQRELLARHIALGDSGLCCDLILDAIDRNGIGKAPESRPSFRAWLNVLAENRGRAWKEWRKSFTAKGGLKASYKTHKFPGLTAEFANERIGRFRDTLSRFDGLEARPNHRDILEIV